MASAKTETSKAVVWLCGIFSGLALSAAGILSKVNHPKAAIWLTCLGIGIGIAGAQRHVGYKRPRWKRKSTFVAVVLTVALVPAGWWLGREVAPPTGTPSISVQTVGKDNTTVVGNSGPVNIQKGDSPQKQETPPEKPPKSKEVPK